MENRAVKLVYIIICTAAVLGVLWLGAKYLLPWLAPFITALALSTVIEPAVRSMVRHGWRRPAAAGCVTAALAAGIVALAALIISRGMNAAMQLTGQMTELVSAAADAIAGLQELIGRYLGGKSTDGTALASVAALPTKISAWLLSTAGRVAQNGPEAVLFAVTAGIGTYFLSASYPKTMEFMRAQLPESFRRRFDGMGAELKSSLGGWMRAQLILMGMTFGELILAMTLLHINGAVIISAVTALIDALPVFGTGIILLPWSAYCFIAGDISRGAGLAVTWAVVSLLRSCVQAKLLGDQIGLDPAVSLFAMYVGWKVWAVPGMLTFPIIAVLLCRLNDRGVIKMWKSV